MPPQRPMKLVDIDASIRRSLALVNIAENYPPETWTHVYTDGSATKAITDGGAGIIIQYPSGATQTEQKQRHLSRQ